MRDLIIIFVIVAVALIGARISSRDSNDNGLETTGDYQIEESQIPGDGEPEIETSSPSGSSAVQTPSVPSTPSTPSVPVGEAGSAASISVSAQSAGTEVVVAAATLTRPTWVAIHEERAGGLGNVLGAGWFPAGTHRDLKVRLLRGMTAGGVYYAALYEDNGNKQYDHRVDAPVKDTLGNPIVFRFDATSK